MSETNKLMEMGRRRFGRWPLGNNPEMDSHAAKHGLSHWSCQMPTHNLLWVRVDGIVYCPAADYFDGPYPLLLKSMDLRCPIIEMPKIKIRLGWSDARGGKHRWQWKAWLWCRGHQLAAWLKRPLPPLVYEWKHEGIIPRWWMGRAYASWGRAQFLYVLYPFHYLVILAWWMQDRWARHTNCNSWIEQEIRRRMKSL